MKLIFKYILLAIVVITQCSCKEKENNNIQIVDLNEANKFFEAGKAKMTYKDNRGALLDFKKAIEYNPKFYEAYMRAAKCNEFLDNRIDAGRYYSGAISIRPNSGEAYYLRGINFLAEPGGKDAACYDFSKSAEIGYSMAKSAIEKYCN